MGRPITFSVIGFTLAALGFPTVAMGTVKSSKANGYVVEAPPTGVTASKANGYVVTSPLKGVTASKANGYVVISPLGGVTASKVMAYAVVQALPITNQPTVTITTKNDRVCVPKKKNRPLDFLFRQGPAVLETFSQIGNPPGFQPQ